MSTSGISVDPDVVDQFAKLKEKSNYKYIICKINDTKQKIIVDRIKDRAECSPNEKNNLDNFKLELPANEGRYCIYDYEYTKDDKSTKLEKKRIVLISWCPDEAPIKDKMVFATSKDALKNSLKINHALQASDLDDINVGEMSDAAK